jgi:ribosome-binding factor A
MESQASSLHYVQGASCVLRAFKQMSKRRVERLSDLVKKELSQILLKKMHDPRMSLCNITDVVLSSDYRHARVYVSIIGDAKQKDECLKALNGAEGFFRHELGKLSLKYVPSLTFYFDTGAEYSQHIEELLRTVRKDDSEE